MGDLVHHVKRLCEAVEDPDSDADTLLERLAHATAAVTALARHDYRRVKTPASSVLVPAYGTPAPSVLVPDLDIEPAPIVALGTTVEDIVNRLDKKIDSIANRLRPRETTTPKQPRNRRTLESRFDGSNGYCPICRREHEFKDYMVNRTSVSFACRYTDSNSPKNRYLMQLGKAFGASPFYTVDNVPWSAVTRVVADAYVRGYEQSHILRMSWRVRDPGAPFTVHNSIIV